MSNKTLPKEKNSRRISTGTSGEKNVFPKADSHKKNNIKELFAGFKGRYGEKEVDWGKPAGEEVW